MNPWEQLAMAGQGQPGLQNMMGMAGVDPKRQENILDELLHNYVLMPQVAQQREALKQSLLAQYMGGIPNAGN